MKKELLTLICLCTLLFGYCDNTVALQTTIVTSFDLSVFFDLSAPTLTGYQEWGSPTLGLKSASFLGNEGTSAEGMHLYLYQLWSPYEQGATISPDPPFFESIVETLDVNGDTITSEAYIVTDSEWSSFFQYGEARPRNFGIGLHTFTYTGGTYTTLSLEANIIEYDIPGYSMIWGAVVEYAPSIYERSGSYHVGNIVAPDKDSSLPPSTPVPEPNTMLLFGTGLVGLLGLVIPKKKSTDN